MSKREIKFRAWESEYEGQMHYSDQEHAAYKDEDGRCSWHITKERVHIELWIYSRGPNNPEMHKVVPKHVIMQYTGLKDKNGREIFEGDVLHLDMGDYAGIKNHDEIFTIGPESFHSDICYVRMVMNYSEDTGAEVIGNIWANPELLEQ